MTKQKKHFRILQAKYTSLHIFSALTISTVTIKFDLLKLFIVLGNNPQQKARPNVRTLHVIRLLFLNLCSFCILCSGVEELL